MLTQSISTNGPVSMCPALPAEKSTSPVALVIAISGHRDLRPEDFPMFQEKIEAIFSELTEKYPTTTLRLLTGLAEGADRIAARAALRMRVPYVAVLPMKNEWYRLDFKTESSDSEYEELLGAADGVIELPNQEGITAEELSKSGSPKRELQYEALARYLVQYSQILIAIWDGSSEIRRGGTGHVLKLKRGDVTEFETEEMFARRRLGVGPTYLIYGQRASTSAPPQPGLETEMLSPLDMEIEGFWKRYRLLERFNSDVVGGGKRLAKEAAQCRQNLVADHHVTNLTAGMEWVAGVYGFADALANRHNRSSWRRWKAAYILLAISGLCLVLAHSHLLSWRLFPSYYISLVALGGLILYDNRSESRGRHEDYRALAEALRVQFFWFAAGLSDLAADHYQVPQFGEMVWIRDAISECALYEIVPEPNMECPPELEQTYKLAVIWISEQKSYFRKTSLMYEKKRRLFHRIAFATAMLGLVAPLMGVLVVRHDIPSWLGMWNSTIAASLMWWAALCWSYVERRGWEQLSRQYARMYRVFADAESHLDRFRVERKFKWCRKAIFELGCEALAESGDWLAMHRAQKLSMKQAISV